LDNFCLRISLDKSFWEVNLDFISERRAGILRFLEMATVSMFNRRLFGADARKRRMSICYWWRGEAASRPHRTAWTEDFKLGLSSLWFDPKLALGSRWRHQRPSIRWPGRLSACFWPGRPSVRCSAAPNFIGVTNLLLDAAPHPPLAQLCWHFPECELVFKKDTDSRDTSSDVEQRMASHICSIFCWSMSECWCCAK
jgi:hypothetical protein